jgi:peptide/nickel transport system permease protein
VSGSEGSAQPIGIPTAVRLMHRAWRMVRRSWAIYRESRLGVVGLVIVATFGAIAILAPVISPYPRDFEAPVADRFIVSQYPKNLTALPNLTYNPPVLGPTTPLTTDQGGGMWLINSVRQGLIFMDFLRSVQPAARTTPFEQGGNLSFTFDITQDFDYGTMPRPSPPLIAVYYIVPGRNTSTGAGPGSRNGAIAFFSSRDFVVVNPFSRVVIFQQQLNFDPVWTGEDPGSSGDMLIALVEREAGATIFPPRPGHEAGPFHYFFAADPDHVVVFEITYVHATDTNRDGSLPSGRTVLEENVSLAASPFAYYNPNRVDSYEDFRAGPSQGIVLPLANGTLEVRNVTGPLRGRVTLSLGGQPATVSGSIGFTRSELPLWLFLPLRSSSAAGIAIFDIGTLRVVKEFSVPNPTWQPDGVPTSYIGRDTYFALFDEASGPSGTAYLFRLNETGAEIAQFRQSFSSRIRTFFEVDQLSQVFVATEDSQLFTVSTKLSGSTRIRAEPFAIIPPPSATLFAYAGALDGTKFTVALTQEELNGAWIEPAFGRAVVHQLLGTSRTPLPPGTYPSGHTYLLGTDFRGGDILTQLFWGTQVAFIVGVLAAGFAVGLGTFVGLIAGYYGKLVDTLLMRTTDVFLVLPFLPIVFVVAEIFQHPSIWVIILVLGIVGWPGIARVIRAQTLSLRERPFVDAARVSGGSDLRIIFYHIAPNVLPFSFLFMTLGVAGAIVTEAFLSFLGLGDATVISWGGMLSTVLTFGGALTAWWWLVPPGLAITFISLGFYLLGRGFDEIVNPRLRRR